MAQIETWEGGSKIEQKWYPYYVNFPLACFRFNSYLHHLKHQIIFTVVQQKLQQQQQQQQNHINNCSLLETYSNSLEASNSNALEVTHFVLRFG
jgi:hypothetical protein